MSKRLNLCEKPLFPGVSIDILSPNGNAYAIIAIITRILKQIDKPKEEIESIQIDMRSSDYLHLLEVASEFVTIEGVEDYMEMNECNN